ncbi:alanine racemase [Gordonia sp. zg691]|uniref:Alanine racemase n=1 Tax=Gordonia jinghuaiqii TaxID=2758710 RepID=A0A7D7QS13_9ACTN|nr:alanine racemase [Gordonia jinghuaiqii]MBD0861994.1 alanine racemase [Gordonia jinghuaiqii]MCR5978781.1 alanine racemase [Gordonia jinghuaiqii]QMT03086.1 alanine racemase [Gordonia jinghuaiqii]
MTSPALTATVDLGAIAHNIGVLRDASGAAVMAVVKADAYGHGALPVARTALAAGAAELGVAHITEARALRAAGIEAPITAWLHTPGADFAAAVSEGIDIALSSISQLDAVVAAARATGVQATVTAKVDTGLNRSGVAVDEWADFAERVAKAHADEAVTLRAVMCHLARGDEPDHPLNDEQAARLDDAVADLARLGAAPQMVHMANSPAALTRPDLARDMVRPGIAMYGRTPVPAHGDFGLIPAMTLSARIALVKNVAAGQGVSYGESWVAPRDTVVAVVPAGYADGVPRLLSGRLRVRIGDRLFDGVGRICMDQLVVDLGPGGAGVREGDEAELFGTGHHGAPTAKDWADAIGTIDYEIVSQIGARVVRRYVGAAQGDSAAQGEAAAVQGDTDPGRGDAVAGQ